MLFRYLALFSLEAAISLSSGARRPKIPFVPQRALRARKSTFVKPCFCFRDKDSRGQAASSARFSFAAWVPVAMRRRSGPTSPGKRGRSGLMLPCWPARAPVDQHLAGGLHDARVVPGLGAGVAHTGSCGKTSARAQEPQNAAFFAALSRRRRIAALADAHPVVAQDGAVPVVLEIVAAPARAVGQFAADRCRVKVRTEIGGSKSQPRPALDMSRDSSQGGQSIFALSF